MDTKGEPLRRKLRAYVALTESEAGQVESALGERQTLAPGAELVYEGQTKRAPLLLLRGWACSFKTLRDGSRQIVDFQFPGDTIGLRSHLLRASDHSVEAVTEVDVAAIAIDRLREIFREHPRLAAAALWCVSRDEAVVVEHLVDLGRRDALERTAHRLLEFAERLRVVGLADDAGFACPLSQTMLADALGLSAIHLNRVLRKLREARLLSFRDGEVRFLDRSRLEDLCGFDTAYLDLDMEPRHKSALA